MHALVNLFSNVRCTHNTCVCLCVVCRYGQPTVIMVGNLRPIYGRYNFIRLMSLWTLMRAMECRPCDHIQRWIFIITYTSDYRRLSRTECQRRSLFSMYVGMIRVVHVVSMQKSPDISRYIQIYGSRHRNKRRRHYDSADVPLNNKQTNKPWCAHHDLVPTYCFLINHDDDVDCMGVGRRQAAAVGVASAVRDVIGGWWRRDERFVDVDSVMFRRFVFGLCARFGEQDVISGLHRREVERLDAWSRSHGRNPVGRIGTRYYCGRHSCRQHTTVYGRHHWTTSPEYDQLLPDVSCRRRSHGRTARYAPWTGRRTLR